MNITKTIKLLRQEAKNQFQSKLFRCLPIFVWIFSILLCLPSLATWLGLPPEGDAVDYRVPIIQWIVRHHTFPNWQWTMVDDYPSLGELLMIPLYLIKPALMRLIPMIAYFGCAWMGGRIVISITNTENEREQKQIFWLCSAWCLGLRPLAIQSNLLMVDNLASFFLLCSLFYTLEERKYLSGFFLAGALATRYTAWPLSLAIFFTSLIFGKQTFKQRLKNTLIIAIISCVGAAPFFSRNLVLNHNPFFPFATNIFNGFDTHIAYYQYGRGKDFLSFLLLPYDLLITNTFINGFYDYTLGKLFYVHLVAAALACAFLLRSNRDRENTSPKFKALIFAASCFLIIWFLGSQQMRFLVPFLIIVEVLLFICCLKYLPKNIVSFLVLLSCFSLVSIQKDSILLALRPSSNPFNRRIATAKNCIERIGIDSNEVIGFANRDSLLGFLDHDFIYINNHPYSLRMPGVNIPEPKYAFSDSQLKGYQPWPESQPCMYKLQ